MDHMWQSDIRKSNIEAEKIHLRSIPNSRVKLNNNKSRLLVDGSIEIEDHVYKKDGSIYDPYLDNTSRFIDELKNSVIEANDNSTYFATMSEDVFVFLKSHYDLDNKNIKIKSDGGIINEVNNAAMLESSRFLTGTFDLCKRKEELIDDLIKSINVKIDRYDIEVLKKIVGDLNFNYDKHTDIRNLKKTEDNFRITDILYNNRYELFKNSRKISSFVDLLPIIESHVEDKTYTSFKIINMEILREIIPPPNVFVNIEIESQQHIKWNCIIELSNYINYSKIKEINVHVIKKRDGIRVINSGLNIITKDNVHVKILNNVLTCVFIIDYNISNVFDVKLKMYETTSKIKTINRLNENEENLIIDYIGKVNTSDVLLNKINKSIPDDMDTYDIIPPIYIDFTKYRLKSQPFSNINLNYTGNSLEIECLKSVPNLSNTYKLLDVIEEI